MGFAFLPHTADEIIEAWGSTEEECLSQLATGLVSGFARPRGDAPRPVRRHFSIDAGAEAGPSERALALLEEIIFLVETEGEVPVSTIVHRIRGGIVEGEFRLVNSDFVEVVGAIPKAVSYSGLLVEHTDTGNWRARATIDV